MTLRAGVRVIGVSAAVVVALTGCSSRAHPPSDAANAAMSRPLSATATTAPAATAPASTASPPTSVSSESAPPGSTPGSRADAVFQHWTAQVPVYPDAGPWEAGERSPADGIPQVEGFFTHTTSWSTTDDVATVVMWFRSRVELAGWAGSLKGRVQQWSLVFTSTPGDRAAVTASSLSLLIGTGGRGTLISVVAAGAPIPERSGRTRIDPDRIVSATVEIEPMGTVPKGYQPRTGRTVSVPPADRVRLIDLLNDAEVRPANTSSGLGFGYGYTLIFRADDGSTVTARFNSSQPGVGTQVTGDRGSEALTVGGEFFTLLDRLCGVVRP